MTWVYDIVRRRPPRPEIVALCYHECTQGVTNPNCLSRLSVELSEEGFWLDLSDLFETLSEAKQHAWANRDSFAPDLD